MTSKQQEAQRIILRAIDAAPTPIKLWEFETHPEVACTCGRPERLQIYEALRGLMFAGTVDLTGSRDVVRR